MSNAKTYLMEWANSIQKIQWEFEGTVTQSIKAGEIGTGDAREVLYAAGIRGPRADQVVDNAEKLKIMLTHPRL